MSRWCCVRMDRNSIYACIYCNKPAPMGQKITVHFCAEHEQQVKDDIAADRAKG